MAVNDARRDRWVAQLLLSQRPVARVTSRLEAVVHFCRIWCANWSYYLERANRAGIAGSPSITQNRLVVSVGTASALARVVARFTDGGYQPAEAENPLSAAQDAVTFDDPDRCHPVLVPGPGV